MKTWFVAENSIVREIWGKADTVLFIFAGAAAEFALNKAVDWLYFTGRLPADPLARLFSTVEYARQIIFADEQNALAAIDRITAIHQDVEKKRDSKIPDWAYRDVLFLLIDYSVRSYEMLERPLTDAEKNEVFDVFCRVGKRMQLTDLPGSYVKWIVVRDEHLAQNLVKSEFTIDLYRQYKKHLGSVRYAILLQVQSKLVPEKVNALLAIKSQYLFMPVLRLYKMSGAVKVDGLLKSSLLPAAYKAQIVGIDVK